MRLAAFWKSECGYKALFEQDGVQVTKYIKASNAALAVGCSEADDVRRSLVRRAREAVRDFAYMKHGPEKWKEHVEWGGFFDAPTDEEKQMIEDALLKGTP